MAPSLVVCPGCACHVRASEAACPLCSATLPRDSGVSLPRTAAAIAMGLAAVVVGCGDDTGGSVGADYGAGPTGSGGGGVTTSSSSGEGGAGGGTTAASTTSSSSSASGSGGGGGEISADYGVGPTGGGSGG